MSWPKNSLMKIRRLKSIQSELKNTFVGRDQAVDLLILATLCREHLLIIGPPGTAKTELINRYTAKVDARGFHYLLSRFTEPSELFGPMDMDAFHKGVYRVNTKGMLPEAEIAFLDEVFQGGSAILNTLLALANERVFHNGAERLHTPLISIIGASNRLPDDPGLRAFVDRFTLRLLVDVLPDERLGDLIDQGWELELARIEREKEEAEGRSSTLIPPLKKGDLLQLHQRLAEVKLHGIRDHYTRLIGDLRTEGVPLSDRRVVRGLKLVAGAALLREAARAEPADLWPLKYLWSREDDADTVADMVHAHIQEGGPAGPVTIREMTEILKDLGILEHQEASIRNEVAMGAHLMALNRLRREILKDHREDKKALAKVEDAIRRGMGRLEECHV